MKRELQFSNDLNYHDVTVIPFIELFQENEKLRNELFQQYLKTETEPDFEISVSSKDEIPEEFHKHSIRRTPLFKKLKEIDTDITDFNLFVLKNRDYNAKNEAEIIVEDIISKLEAIGLQYLTELVLKHFVEQQKRNFERLEMLNKHSYDADKAKIHYRHFTRYANKVVKEYLIALPSQTTKEAEQKAFEYNLVKPGYLSKADNVNNQLQFANPPPVKNDLTKEQLFEEQNYLIPDVDIIEVYDFFKVLVTKPNRKGGYYLNEEKLLKFIKATFVDEKPIKQKFNVPFSKDKIDVRSVFKRFQDYCYDLEYNKTNVKDKYFAIMFEGFEGFSKKADSNKWHKTNNKLPTPKGRKAK